jgi:hypothetical protein
MPASHFVADLLARTVGALLAGPIGASARLLNQRPLHPWGVMLRGALVVAEDEAGAQVLPQGRTEAMARLSLGAGLPRGWPDVVGLAMRWHAGGEAQDLLLSSAGPGRLARFLPLPRRRLMGWFSTVMPLRTASGPALLALRYDRDATALTGTVTLEMLVASPRGPWRRFGALELHGPDTRPGGHDGDTPSVRFDPTLHAPRGMGTYVWEDRLRSPAYAAARRGAPVPHVAPVGPA